VTEIDPFEVETTTGSNTPDPQVPVTNLPAEPADPIDDVNQANPVLPTIPDPLASDPQTPVTTGSPGLTVDCQKALPCSWVSADSQFTVTVGNADNIGERGRLSIEYEITTSHDTEILVATADPAIDDAGISYEPSAVSLGNGTGGSTRGVMAGATLPASIEFDSLSNAGTLTSWTIGLSDAGLLRQPEFTNIPVGPATTEHTDCQNMLPCVWESPDGEVTITLLSTNGSGASNRLSTSFKVETVKRTVVAVDRGATAVGVDGLTYLGRTHTVGVQNGSQKITSSTLPGAFVGGTVYFSRTQAMSPSLQHLSLIIYEDSPTPRWNPQFLSVPIQ